MEQPRADIDVEKELEELPSLISFKEKSLEDAIIKLDEAKNAKSTRLAQYTIDHIEEDTELRKAMCKKLSAEIDKDIIGVKKEISSLRVELNHLKNRFQSVRKIANMRIEEMKHGL